VLQQRLRERTAGEDDQLAVELSLQPRDLRLCTPSLTKIGSMWAPTVLGLITTSLCRWRLKYTAAVGR
jgi:hypothetical protein